MNELEELAEQAKEHANSYDDAGTPIWFQFYNEKFAELIVRECAPQSTHSADCWKWHHQCAIAKIKRECEHD